MNQITKVTQSTGLRNEWIDMTQSRAGQMQFKELLAERNLITTAEEPETIIDGAKLLFRPSRRSEGSRPVNSLTVTEIRA